MGDVLIRDVPDKVLAVIDERAADLGLSRTEYLHRLLRQQAELSGVAVTVADLKRVSGLTRDLLDPGVLGRAWS